MNPFIHKLVRYGYPVAQLLLGLTFVFSGFVKVIDPVGAFIKLDEYFIAFGVDIPRAFQYVLAVGQGILEFVLGASVLLGLWKKETAWLLLLFMLLITPFTLYLAIANPVSDCGCFGDAIKLTNWQTFSKNGFLLLFAFVYFRYNDRSPVLYGKRTSRWSFYWCVLFSLLLSVYSYRHLPLVDFMPFKVGNDLNALTASRPDSVDYRFVYEKDGVRETFGVDNLPATTDGWSYVDRSEVVVREGSKPVIDNLSILHPRKGDVTTSILSDTSYVFLYVSTKLEFADRGNVEKANRVYEYASQQGYSFFGLTGSGQETIEEWRYEYDTPFDFCAADDKLLTTIIRSNPGLVLLKQGVVVRKWAFRDIPDFYKLSKPLRESSLGRVRQSSLFRVLGLVLLVFVFPLVFFHQLHTGKTARWTHKRIKSNLSI